MAPTALLIYHILKIKLILNIFLADFLLACKILLLDKKYTKVDSESNKNKHKSCEKFMKILIKNRLN